MKQNFYNRYQRQLGIHNWGEKTQDKLQNSSVFIAGAGGLGSSTLFYCAAAGIGTIYICDYDTVDLTNLNRQILHSIDTVGMLKVKSASSTLLKLNDTINIIPINNKIESEEALESLNKSSLAIDCLDNFDSRRKLNQYCIDAGKPLIHAGISEYHGQITFIKVPETPCLNCFLPEKDHDKPTYILGATAGVLGSLQCMEAIKYLTDNGENLKNKLLFFDGLTMKFETISISRNPHCKTCAIK